jgi:hypothetical protein
MLPAVVQIARNLASVGTLPALLVTRWLEDVASLWRELLEHVR